MSRIISSVCSSWAPTVTRSKNILFIFQERHDNIVSNTTLNYHFNKVELFRAAFPTCFPFIAALSSSVVPRLNVEKTGPIFPNYWPGFSQFALISPWSPRSALQSASTSLAPPQKNSFNVHFVRLISAALCTDGGGAEVWAAVITSGVIWAIGSAVCAGQEMCRHWRGTNGPIFLTNPDGCLTRNWSKLTVSDNYGLPLK